MLVSVHTPVLRSGRAVRTYGVARALAAAGRRLTFVYVRFGAEEPDVAHRAIPGIDARGGRALARRPAARSPTAAARLRGVPEDFARGVSPELTAAVRRLAPDPDTRVIADGPTEAGALAGLARRRPVIYNAHNLESAYRHQLGSSRGLGSPDELRRFEAGVLARSAECWMVSEADMAAARELCPSRQPAARPERRRRRRDRAGRARRGGASCPLRRQLHVRAKPQRAALSARRRHAARVGASCPARACGSSARAWTSRRRPIRASRRSASWRTSPTPTRASRRRSSRCCRAAARR